MGESVSSESTVSPVWYWLIGAAAVFALIGLSLLEREPSAETGGSACEVRGRVRDGAGRPVTTFEISIESESSRRRSSTISVNEENGEFAFTVPRGTFRLTCSAPGFEVFHTALAITGESYWLPVTLR